MNQREIFDELTAIVMSSGQQDIDAGALQLDDRPFREHGIDSMTLIRMVGQVEERFRIEIDDSDAMVAFSFERLVELIQGKLADTGGTVEASHRNFYAALRSAAVAAGPDAVVRGLQHRGEDPEITQLSLIQRAAGLGRSIPAGSPQEPSTVVIVAVEPVPTLIAFVAALGVGARPLVMPTPKSLGGVDEFTKRLTSVVGAFSGTVTVALQSGLLPALSLPQTVGVVDLPVRPEHYFPMHVLPPLPTAGGDDVAFLQTSSGSTGDAKLIAISHANVLSNLAALRTRLGMGEVPGQREQVVSWLPLYHDMGLVGGALFPLLNGFSTAIMKPTDFIQNPVRWLRAVSDLQATFTGAPNFGLDYSAIMIDDRDLEGLDLSHLRRVGVAAEPIHRAALQRFVDRFTRYGLRSDIMVPGLGMAESTLACTTLVGHEARYVVVDAGRTGIGQPVVVHGRGVVSHPATPVPEGSGVAVFSLGTAMPGLEVTLCDENGLPIEGEGVLGEVVVRGDAVCLGYYDAAAECAKPLPDGVLRSGDLGFLLDGELYLLGRMKNVIIRRGVNYVASLLEEQVGEVLGLPPFGLLLMDEDIYDERSAIHVIVENASEGADLNEQQMIALRNLQLPVDVVTFVRGFTLPRTTSGKKRYHVARQLLSVGDFDVVRSVDVAGA